MSRIVTKTSEEINRELIEETAKQAAEKTAETLRKTILESPGSGVKGSKVSQILKKATSEKDKEKEEENESLEEVKKKERMELDKEREKLQKEKEESEVYCPTCSGAKHEHKHLLKKTDSGTLKCTGEGCNTEYLLVPKDATYKCTDCGLPKKKPTEDNPDDKCPYCNSKTFVKYNWDKIVNKNKKK
ncbi:MAG: hypothetical protein PHP08_00480 [Candidatus Dojkabacteria bacterium]|nr:hypothetical protein [Candidatus Dojkabacteria bacterium]